jgi:molecular chaperone GrpE
MQTERHWQEPVGQGNGMPSRVEPYLDFTESMQAPSPEPDEQPTQQTLQPERADEEHASQAEPTDASPSEVTEEKQSDQNALELELKEKLAKAEAKAAEIQDALIRAKAELENFRRRAQEDVTRAHKFAIEGFAESLVPVKDSLETALKIDTPTLASLKEGVEMTLKQLNTAFEKNRLTEISPMRGDKLDPMKHQAISMEPVEQNPNTIINVLQKGYMIADRLLRPALVTVAQDKASKNEA